MSRVHPLETSINEKTGLYWQRKVVFMTVEKILISLQTIKLSVNRKWAPESLTPNHCCRVDSSVKCVCVCVSVCVWVGEREVVCVSVGCGEKQNKRGKGGKKVIPEVCITGGVTPLLNRCSFSSLHPDKAHTRKLSLLACGVYLSLTLSLHSYIFFLPSTLLCLFAGIMFVRPAAGAS